MGISGRLLRWHMTHIAIVGKINGKRVDWMEKVSDEQYEAPTSKETQCKNVNSEKASWKSRQSGSDVWE